MSLDMAEMKEKTLTLIERELAYYDSLDILDRRDTLQIEQLEMDRKTLDPLDGSGPHLEEVARLYRFYRP